MDLNALKLGFLSYLQNLEKENLNSDEDELELQNYSDISIFTHTKEFKEYLQEEYNVSADILSLSINDLMNLKIENGKLVNPEEKETSSEESVDTHVSGEIQTSSGEGEVSEMPQTANISAAAEGDEISETPQDANAQAPAVEGQISEIPQDNIQITVPVLESSEVPADSQTENDKENISLIDFMNMLFEDKDFLNEYDGNGNGTIDEDEFLAFQNSIKALDGNADDISFEDILKKANEIKESNVNEQKQDTPILDETQEPAATEGEIPEQIQSSPQVQSTGGGGGGSYSPGNYTNNSSPASEAKLEDKSVEEIKSELNKAQGDLSEKQETLTNIANGTDPQIASMKEDADKALDEYNKALEDTNNEDAKELASVNTQIAEREQEIQENDAAITNQEATVEACTSNYEAAEANLSQLESQKEALIAANNDSETSESQKSRNAEKLQAIEEAIAQAETEKQNALEAKEEAEKTLKELNDKKEEIEKKEPSLEELEQQKSDLESNLSSLLSSEPLAGLKETYETAKTTYETEKQSALTQAQSDVTDAQERVNEVNEALKVAQDRENQRNYKPGDIGQSILEEAMKYLGANEANNLADKFVQQYGNYDSSTTPWCASYVEYVLRNSGEYDNVAEWYKTANGSYDAPKWGCGAVLNNAPEGAKLDVNTVKPGDLVLFNWDGKGASGADHIGFFVGIENGKIVTLEGNTSNEVAYRTYDLNSPYIKAFLDITYTG